jgi:hypothetical protein
MRLTLKQIFALALLFTGGLLRAQTDTIDLRSHGSLTLYLDDNWKVGTSEFGDRVIVNIEPKDDTNATCTMTITFPEQDRLSTKAKLKTQVEVSSRVYEESSVEGKSVARELNTQAGYGYYCSFTDPELVGKPPQKGNFKTISVGMVHVTPDVLIEFGINADGFRSEPYQQLLGALEGMEYKPRRVAGELKRPVGSPSSRANAIATKAVSVSSR